MIRLIAVVFALAVATSAQAMSLAPLHQADSMITQGREGRGAGMHMINGRCVTHPPAATSAAKSSGPADADFCAISRAQTRGQSPLEQSARRAD